MNPGLVEQKAALKSQKHETVTLFIMRIYAIKPNRQWKKLLRVY